MSVFDGGRDQALSHLRWVRDEGDKNSSEHKMVTDVLKAL